MRRRVPGARRCDVMLGLSHLAHGKRKIGSLADKTLGSNLIWEQSLGSSLVSEYWLRVSLAGA